MTKRFYICAFVALVLFVALIVRLKQRENGAVVLQQQSVAPAQEVKAKAKIPAKDGRIIATGNATYNLKG